MADRPSRSPLAGTAGRILLKKGIRNDHMLLSLPLPWAVKREYAAALDTFALIRSQYWPQRALKELQRERLRRLCAHAGARILFWRERLRAAGVAGSKVLDEETFCRIPILKKTEFKTLPIASYTDARLFAHSTEGKTSGSTGEPFVFFTDRFYRLRGPGFFRRVLAAINGGSRCSVISVSSRRPFRDRNVRWLHVASWADIPGKMEELVLLVAAERSPVVLYGFPSYLLEFGRLGKETGTALPVAAVLLTGERITDEQGHFLSEAFGAPVFSCYGMSEVGWIAASCEFGALHVNSESELVEIVDENGDPLSEDRMGRIVVTEFDNYVMPFIRYDSGDLGMLLSASCPCGRTLPLLQVIGRQGEMIRLRDGKRIPFIDFLGIFERRYRLIRQYQLVQEREDSFVARIVPERDFDPKERALMLAELANKFPVPVHVRWEEAKLIERAPNGKAVYFRSLLPYA